jgi:hypothetical protein
MIVTARTPFLMSIEKGSSLLLFIPPQFQIIDPLRVQSSCTMVSGFSDEILCELVSTNQRTGHFLRVFSGFESETFPGGEFSFWVSDIINPFTTEETDSFGLQVLDRNN